MNTFTPRNLSPVLAALVSAVLLSCSPPDSPDVAENAEAGVGAGDTELAASAPHPGEAPYNEHCARCHDAGVYKATSRTFLAMLGARNVLRAMESGSMQEQASTLDDAARRAVAEYLTGQSFADLSDPPTPPACAGENVFDRSVTPVTLGWGVDRANTRFQPAERGGLTASDLGDLEVKWAFAYPNAIQARSEPVFGGGALYFGSQDGTVWALDARTGCLRWTYRAVGEVRNAIVLSPWDPEDPASQPTLYFADIVARVYAVDARTGELRWTAKVDEHPDATVTASVVLHEGRLYVPVSSLEVVPAANPKYPCCTFRGSVVALDAATGSTLWKSYTIDKAPAEVGRNRVGTPILAPSGAPVWNTPTIDAQRGRLYVGTGENYSSPADGNSDAIIAFDLATGEKVWVSQQTERDAWNTACLSQYATDDANCPEENGPDYDFGAPPILVTLDDGGQLLVAGQKSGRVVGLDPDTGEARWRTQVGRGGVQGGVQFGMAAEGQRVYVPINDMRYPEDETRYDYTFDPRPGLYALDAASGELLWSAPAPERCGGREGCDPGISHAVTAVPGAVIAGHLDGWLRVYDGQTGAVMWELDSTQEFATVSGVAARGGSFSGSSGAVVADGLIYVNSGYGIYNHMPGNLLLVLGPAQEVAGP